MRALQCVKPGTLVVVDRPEPAPGPGEVLVRIRRAGVCGTDLHIYEGSHPYLAYPRVIGHELSGEIAAAGPNCAIAPGQQVYVIPYLSCGRCVACRHGKTNCCQKIGVLGVHVDGGMAEYVCVPERNVVAADGVTLDQAAMVEFLAIGAHAVRRANPRKTDRILVVGAGPIGIGCMLFARLRGSAVTVLDMRQDRLDFARRRLGVEHGVTASADSHADPVAPHRRRLLRRRHRCHRKRQIDDVQVSATSPMAAPTYWFSASFATPSASTTPSFISARRRCRAAETRHRRISVPYLPPCGRDCCPPMRWSPIAPCSNRRPNAFLFLDHARRGRDQSPSPRSDPRARFRSFSLAPAASCRRMPTCSPARPWRRIR